MTHNHSTTAHIAQALIIAGIADELINRRGTITPNSTEVLKRRYLAKDPEGNIIEDSPGMFRRVAKNLSQADVLYGANEATRQQTEDLFYAAMITLELLPNSPTLMNAARELQQLSACFVLPVEDDLDSIFESVKQTAIIHKSGGGTGFAFSRLRPEGSKVGSTGGVASGPVSFINAFDTATDVVKQGGTRRGANMGILDVHHPDIMKFIQAKASGDKLQNFNISVGASNVFMDRVKTSQDYDLINPATGQKTGTLNAHEVFEEIAHHAWLTGDPGLVFLDHINDTNPNPKLGRIESTNPCGEQVLLPYESCNLASVNLGRMTEITPHGFTLSEARLEHTVTTAVHLLDNVIDMNRYPLPQVAEMTKRTRRIGLGVMGLADLLIQLGLPYDSQEALQFTGHVMGLIHRMANDASSELAKQRESFPTWATSIYGPDLAGNNSRPMRNSAPTTVAPTGTISVIAGASSGVEPLFALAYERNVMDNTRLYESNPYLEAIARYNDFYSDNFIKQVAATGTLENTDAPQWVKDLFKTSQEISPESHVRMQAAVQQHVDNAVSKTINFPHEATANDIQTAYMLAYDLKCKGITVYRDGSKDNQVLSTARTRQQETSSNTHQNADAPPAMPAPRERPRDITGVTQRLRTGHGNMYITVNNDEEGIPFEVFGNLGKAGGCDSAQLEAITRLTTLALRSRISPDEIISQMQGITCCPAWEEGVLIKSSPDALALALYRLTQGSANPAAADVQLLPQHIADRPTGPMPAPRERPRDITGVTQRLRTGHGNMYITVNNDEEGIPFEVFGNLGKAGGCDSAQLEAITRLTTLALRSRISPDEIISQMQGITCCPAWEEGVLIKSSPDALALALYRLTQGSANPAAADVQLLPQHIADRPTGPACPDCNTPVFNLEGCPTCPSCGWSKCA